MHFRFFIIPFIALLTTIISIWWYVDATNTIWIISTLLLGYVWAAWRLDPDRKDWWRFTIIPLLAAVSILFFSLLISGLFTYSLLAIFSVILQLIYWRQLLIYTSESSTYIPFSLERLSFNYNFIIIFFLVASMYGFRRFLDISIYIIGPVFGFCLAVLIVQRLWISQSNRGGDLRLAISIFIGVMELFLIASFLPLDFRLLAFLVTAAYYGFVSLGSEQTEHEVSKVSLRILIIIIALGCIAVFATARWY
jgi:hypothetical protein